MDACPPLPPPARWSLSLRAAEATHWSLSLRLLLAPIAAEAKRRPSDACRRLCIVLRRVLGVWRGRLHGPRTWRR
jgi:hypothetical protein